MSATAREPASRPPAGPRAEDPAAGGRLGRRFAVPGYAGMGVSARLAALARMVQIGAAQAGPDGFSEQLLTEARELLARAGERLQLSADHTVVALAGGTGSGKSSLFNRVAGADFSTVGVTRPVTRDVHACVWGVSGSGSLLEWLGVPRRYRYARASALDSGEESMTGLVLLDLPDHDSVMTHAGTQADRIVGLADLMIWVLDPQKYADAAVHRRFLVPLAGHSEVLTVVLNQADTLDPAQVEDCVHDLRRLLDAEELHDVQIVVTSAITGAGLDELRKVLIEAVTARKAATARISADIDRIAGRFAPYAGAAAADGRRRGSGFGGARFSDGTGYDGTGYDGSGYDDTGYYGEPEDSAPGPAVPLSATDQLANAFAAAAGVIAVGDALQSARELRAVDYVGWPFTWLAERVLHRSPMRKIRLGRLWDELRSVTTGPTGAQQAEVDNALTRLADEIAPQLPEPWSHTVRAAVRSQAGQVPQALGAAIGEALPVENKLAGWWRLVGIWQGLLLGAVIVGIIWLGTILAFGVFQAGHAPRLFSDVAMLAAAAGLVVVALALGWLTARLSMNAVRAAAQRENQLVVTEVRRRLAVVAREMAAAPAERELAELERFRAELRTAAGQPA